MTDLNFKHEQLLPSVLCVLIQIHTKIKHFIKVNLWFQWAPQPPTPNITGITNHHYQPSIHSYLFINYLNDYQFSVPFNKFNQSNMYKQPFSCHLLSGLRRRRRAQL